MNKSEVASPARVEMPVVRCRHCKTEQPFLIVGQGGGLWIQVGKRRAIRITGYYCEVCGKSVRWGER